MTPFEDCVYKEAATIPLGKVRTYKDIAKAIGFPRAARAVGNALHKNKNPQVPCHRVVRSNGVIGGFRYGSAKKKTLLQKEGVLVSGNKVVSTREGRSPE
ncbi:MAG: MGMT family protein [bacterium]|nr:MGMT family protein [bacterium]